METEPFDSPAASCPRWVILDRDGYPRDSASDAAKTSAAACTSTGRPFRVSFCLAPPPATSRLYYDWAGGASPYYGTLVCKPHVIAAHGDCVLLGLSWVLHEWLHHSAATFESFDYFVYKAGTPARPPSLKLLPACYLSTNLERRVGRSLKTNDTGLLRRGEDDMLLVVQLELTTHDITWAEANLLVLRGLREWELIKRVPIVHNDGGRRCGRDELRWRWKTDAAVAVGDRFMCWVDYYCGVLFCDMAKEASPQLRYVPLPMVPPERSPNIDSWYYHVEYAERWSRNACVNMCAAGPRALRFVDVEPRCGCCGRIPAGKCTCPDDRFAFTMTAWTLSLTIGGKPTTTWVKDGVLDCEELWALPEYQGLPRVVPEYPIVSSDDPDVVCFKVRNDYLCDDDDLDPADTRAWMVEVDTRSKALRSELLPYSSIGQPYSLVATKLQC